MVNQINNNNNAFKLHWDLQFYYIYLHLNLSFNFILDTAMWDRGNYNHPNFECGKKMRLKGGNMPNADNEIWFWSCYLTPNFMLSF